MPRVWEGHGDESPSPGPFLACLNWIQFTPTPAGSPHAPLELVTARGTASDAPLPTPHPGGPWRRILVKRGARGGRLPHAPGGLGGVTSLSAPGFLSVKRGQRSSAQASGSHGRDAGDTNLSEGSGDAAGRPASRVHAWGCKPGRGWAWKPCGPCASVSVPVCGVRLARRGATDAPRLFFGRRSRLLSTPPPTPPTRGPKGPLPSVSAPLASAGPPSPVQVLWGLRARAPAWPPLSAELCHTCRAPSVPPGCPLLTQDSSLTLGFRTEPRLPPDRCLWPTSSCDEGRVPSPHRGSFCHPQCTVQLPSWASVSPLVKQRW